MPWPGFSIEAELACELGIGMGLGSIMQVLSGGF